MTGASCLGLCCCWRTFGDLTDFLLGADADRQRGRDSGRFSYGFGVRNPKFVGFHCWRFCAVWAPFYGRNRFIYQAFYIVFATYRQTALSNIIISQQKLDRLSKNGFKFWEQFHSILHKSSSSNHLKPCTRHLKSVFKTKHLRCLVGGFEWLEELGFSIKMFSDASLQTYEKFSLCVSNFCESWYQHKGQTMRA